VLGIEIVLLVVIAVLMTLVLARLPVITASLVTILLAVVLVGINLHIWSNSDFVQPIATPLCFLFVLYLLHYTDIPAHVGLALATTGSAYCNAGLLALALRRERYLAIANTFLHTFFKVLLASAGMSLLLMLFTSDITVWSSLSWHLRIVELVKLIVPAALFYALLLWIMGIRRSDLVH